MRAASAASGLRGASRAAVAASTRAGRAAANGGTAATASARCGTGELHRPVGASRTGRKESGQESGTARADESDSDAGPVARERTQSGRMILDASSNGPPRASTVQRRLGLSPATLLRPAPSSSIAGSCIYRATQQQPVAQYSAVSHAPSQRTTHVGHSTTVEPKEGPVVPAQQQPFYFETGYAVFAKRRSRPFPPPFLSLPSGSFSEPLSTHDRSQDRRPHVNNEVIRGVTNGDDAVLAERNFVGANDGVGQWATRPRGHAALWSRLVLHFWAREVEAGLQGAEATADPVVCLQRAYEATREATASPEWHGTTTACSALLLRGPGDQPRVLVTNLGDSQVMVLRPSAREVLYKTAEQWHWFDCPRQLGTNSPDTPQANAVCDAVDVRDGDVVLAMTDGVPDNLWEHEITECVFACLDKLNAEPADRTGVARAQDVHGNGMMWVAEELVKATRQIAEDPFAESPYMERAVEEGLAIEGGKMDDISVVAAVCRRTQT